MKVKNEAIESRLRRDRLSALCAVSVTAVVGLSIMGLAGPPSALAAATAGCSEQAQAAAGFSSPLPDCRAYEMVSPASKNGAEVGYIAVEPLIQAAPDGGAITYYADNPIVDSAEGNPEEDRVFSTFNAGVWRSQDISTAHTVQAGAATHHEFLFFSPSLSEAAVQPHASPAAPLDLRNNESGTYELVAAPEGAEPTPPEFLAASPDLSSIVFAPSEIVRAEPSGSRRLYVYRQGQRQLVSILPDEESYGGYVAGEARLNDNGVGLVARNDVSNDGKLVFWESTLLGHEHTIHLFVRNLETEHTVRVDAPQGVAEEAEGETDEQGAAFQTASVSGSEVFFTDSERLTSGAEPGDLYSFNVTKGHLTDLSVNAGEAANVQGVVPGASEDGSYIYFVATGALTSEANAHGEHAVAGEDNLYVAHDDRAEWSRSYIATLSHSDAQDWDGPRAGGAGANGLEKLTSRVSPNGHFFAFMSERSLSGYDTVDANVHTPDEEVYEYDAIANTVICASCNPTLPRPHGIYDTAELRAEFQGNWKERWIAASVPGWTGAQGEHAPHQSRYLSNGGRLFFDSPEKLVPQDTNGLEDVYEYEPDGVGACGNGSLTMGVTAYGGAGCVGLISGGGGTEESEFVDASETGDDVFFVTSQPLVSEDTDTNRDMYDAHVCSTEAPCPDAVASTAESCVSVSACRTGTPGVSLFSEPSSASIAGDGNLAPPVSKSAVKSKSLIRAQKFTHALKACRKNKTKTKRATCEKKAWRAYGRSKS